MRHDGSEMIALNGEEPSMAQRDAPSSRSSPVSLGSASTHNCLFGPHTKNTTLRRMPPEFERLGTNRAMMIEDALSSSSLEDLLHQALVQGDQNAWVGIQQCLSETVRSWLHAHPSKEAALSFVSEEYYVALTFERLRRAAIKRQMTCETLSRVLVYLRASLNGAILEMLRVSSRPRVVSERMAGERSLRGHPESLEVWDRLRALLSNEREQRLAYLLYHCGLSPAEIVLRCPQEWSDVQEIHRLRHTILERLLHNANQLTLTAQTRRGDATRG